MIAFLADAFVKSTVILVLAAIVTICLRRSSASLRHLVWTLACGGVLALPLASALLPNWRVAGWPRLDVPMTFDANEQREPPLAAAASVAQVPHAVTPATTGAPAVRSSITLNWTALVLPVWLGGVLAVLIAVAIGMARIAWLERITPPVEDESWWLLVEDLSLEVGLTRQVRLLQAKGAAMPMTWGIRQRRHGAAGPAGDPAARRAGHAAAARYAVCPTGRAGMDRRDRRCRAAGSGGAADCSAGGDSLDRHASTVAVAHR